jgi:death-on-curing protein
MSDRDLLPTPDEILTIHEEIEEAEDMKYRGVRVAAPKLDLREFLTEAAEYDDIYLRAAFLLRKLITAHLFEDGNKRTAWAVTREYLGRHGLEPAQRDVSTERVLRRIRRYEVEEIATWLESGDLDRDRLHP